MRKYLVSLDYRASVGSGRYVVRVYEPDYDLMQTVYVSVKDGKPVVEYVSRAYSGRYYRERHNFAEVEAGNVREAALKYVEGLIRDVEW